MHIVNGSTQKVPPSNNMKFAVTPLVLTPCVPFLPRDAASRPSVGWSPLRTKIPDFTGFDSSGVVILRGGIPRPIGNFPEVLSQAILVGLI